VYVISKSNATIRGSKNWKKLIQEFIQDTENFLKEYYRRENSESGIARDKKMFGWKAGQKREDRVDKAISAMTICYNLLFL
jgi:transposase